MSETNPETPENGAQRPPSPTSSEKSIKSDISTASSRLPKPTGMRPPTLTATIKNPTTSSASALTSTPNSTRIGRLCTAHGHGAKAGPPPLELHKSKYRFFYSSKIKNKLNWHLISCRATTTTTPVYYFEKFVMEQLK